jgi:general secretion pathway protein L
LRVTRRLVFVTTDTTSLLHPPLVLILTPAAFSLASASTPSAALDWVGSANGQRVDDHGTGAPALLPPDPDVVLVLPPLAVSWHRVDVPKVPAAKLRAVLEGLLEEQLLNDCADLHFALPPGARPGQTIWVAACNKAWLRSWLQALEAAGHPASRIVPALWPLMPATGETPEAPDILHWAHLQSGQPWLASAGPLGVCCVPLASATDPAALLQASDTSNAAPARWMSEPGTAGQAEETLNQRFELVPQAEWLLRCAQSSWNLAQFDLRRSNSARRGQRWRQVWRDVRSAPAWRPARWGMGVLAVVHLLGINTAAWQERRELAAKQAAVQNTLKQAFPDVGLVLDAPLQMQRELHRLQQAGGQLAMHDLEAMLSAVALAAAEQPLAVEKIRYDGTTAYFDGGSAADIPWSALQDSLQRSGWRVSREGNELGLSPNPP